MCMNSWGFHYPSFPAIEPLHFPTSHETHIILYFNYLYIQILIHWKPPQSSLLTTWTLWLCVEHFPVCFVFWTCFVTVLSVEPHPQIKGILHGLYYFISIVDNLLIDTKNKTSLYICLLFTRSVSVYWKKWVDQSAR